MKKLFILATAAVALASCSDSDLVGNIASSQQTEQPQAVEFGTYMGSAATRAGVAGTITTASLKTGTHKDAGFGVMGHNTGTTDWASATAPNFMYNEQITWNTNGYWTYDPVKYWPNGIDAANAANNPSNTAVSTNGDKLSFFAYAPWVDVASSDYSSTAIKTALKLGDDATGKNAFYATGCSNASITSGIAAITANTVANDPEVFYYMPQAKIESSVDLLWGLRGSKQYQETDNTDNPDPALSNLGSTYNLNLTKQDVPETVNFLFKHALSKVGGNTKSTTSTSGQQKCGLKVVLDVDANGNGLKGVDNQSLYLGGSGFDNTKTLVTIKSVAVQDGTSAYAERASVTDPKNALPDSPVLRSNLQNGGWFNIAKGTWSAVTIVDDKGSKVTTDPSGATYSIVATTDGTYKLDPQIAEPTTVQLAAILDANKDKWNGTGLAGSPNGVVATTAKNVYSNETDVPSLLMIPNGTNAQTLYVTVDYIVRTADPKLSTGYSEIEQTVTNEVSLTGLDVNKYYTLVMHLGLTSVKFSAIVSDWANSDNATYDEDGTHDGDAEAAEEVWLPSNVVAQTTTTAAAPGTASNVNTAASNTTYDITLNNLAEGQKISAASTGNITTVKIGSHDITSEYTLTAGDLSTGAATITVTLTPNTKVKAASNLLTITQKNSAGTVLTTTTVNIVQSAFDVVLAETTAGSVVSTKDGDGNNIDTSSGYTVTVVNSEGASVTSGVAKALGSITITPAGVYTVKVVYSDGTDSITRTIDIHN